MNHLNWTFGQNIGDKLHDETLYWAEVRENNTKSILLCLFLLRACEQSVPAMVVGISTSDPPD